jgi:hypothetical protein
MSSDDNSVRTHDYSHTLHHAAESIRTAASTSPAPNELIETLVRTGTFEEIAQAILETILDMRESTKEENETVKHLIQLRWLEQR